MARGMIKQPFQPIRAKALACLRRRTLTDKRRLRIRQRQAEIIHYFANGFVAIQRQRHHQPNDLFGRQSPVANAGGIGALHGLFDPLDRQMLSESPPVG